MSHAPRFLALVQEAKQKVREFTVTQIAERFERKESFYFVDVREDSEWSNGHAAGARHIGKGVIERDIEALIPDKNADIVLYCGGGFRSALAADALQRMGYTRVSSMDGGFKGWAAAGLAVEKPKLS